MKKRPIKVIKANSNGASAPVAAPRKNRERAVKDRIAENISSWIEESRKRKDDLRSLAVAQLAGLSDANLVTQ